MLHRSKKKLKKEVKVKLDLMKSRFTLLNKSNNHEKVGPNIKFSYLDLDCHLKGKFNDESQKDLFFSFFDNLRDFVDTEV